MKFLFIVCLLGLYFLVTVLGGEGGSYGGGPLPPPPPPPPSYPKSTTTTLPPTSMPTLLRKHSTTNMPTTWNGVTTTSSGGVTTTSSGGVTTTSSGGVTTTSGGTTTTSSGGVTTTSSGGVTTTSSGGVTTTSGGVTTTTTGVGPTTGGGGGGTPGSTASTTASGAQSGGGSGGQTSNTTNSSCYQYIITIGQGGLLNLTEIILGLPCPDLCLLLETNLLTLNIPLHITLTIAGQLVTATGHIGVGVSGQSCGLIIYVDLNPVMVTVSDLIILDICLDLRIVVRSLGVNPFIGTITGTLAVYLESILSTFNTLVPNLCSLIPA